MKYARPGQALNDHLMGVATKTAARLPTKWQPIGHYAGLWHDLGKILKQWQDYLNSNDRGRRMPHSPHGAMLARSLMNRPLVVPSLTFVIAGHHGGLRDKEHLAGDDFAERAIGWEQARDEAIAEIPNFLPEKLPEFDVRGTRLEFAIRMLFGCLVDADRIDAAIFMGNAPPNLDEASSVSKLSTCFNPRHQDGALAQLRREFASDCMAKAEQPRGLFRLTGPTGVGKTMASLQWAIAHCKAHPHHQEKIGLESILYVGPLQSIIEQNWNVYREVLGIPVLAHYSDFQPCEEELPTYKLTTERWDASVICTSGVQFYESLFARTPAKCRKLSHLMRRCILIDEAQSIPLEYAKPILDVLRALAEDWGCTVVLMSATQPSFRNVDADFDKKCTDIIEDDRCRYFFEETRRVTYTINIDLWQWNHVADRIDSLPEKFTSQSLTIVNTTRLAREGFQALSEIIEGSWFHLSARMVPAHRKQVLEEILRRTSPTSPKEKLSCHVISTQVVEAGVDLDFPLVLRQFAPLDSIIQAAGRCNRENHLNWRDAFIQVFDLEDANYPSGDYKKRTQITCEILASSDYDLNENLLAAISLYYKKCNSSLTGDTYKIQELRKNLQFEKVAEQFKIINDDHQFSSVVPWGNGADLIKSLDLSKPLSEPEWRSLQPYTLNLPEKQFRNVVPEPTLSGVIVFPADFYSAQFGASDCLQDVVC
jgi:CRISPR-associated endonuclease/helicase Cas3